MFQLARWASTGAFSREIARSAQYLVDVLFVWVVFVRFVRQFAWLASAIFYVLLALLASVTPSISSSMSE